MIPLILENEVAVPRQIARVVHLPFREVQYNSDFEHLLLSLGVEASPFALTSDLHVTFSRGRVFDVEREVAIYASSLIRNNPNVSSVFESLSENVRRAAGGRWRMPSAQTVIWQAETFRAARQPQFVRASEWTVMVVFALHAGYSSGYESKERVIIEIAASDLLKYDYIGERPDTVLHSHTLELKFEGFRNLVASPVE